METAQIVTLSSIRDLSIEEFLNQLRQQEAIAVQFPDGESIIVQAKQELEPLPILDGYVPEGWKAVYAEASTI